MKVSRCELEKELARVLDTQLTTSEPTRPVHQGDSPVQQRHVVNRTHDPVGVAVRGIAVQITSPYRSVWSRSWPRKPSHVFEGSAEWLLQTPCSVRQGEFLESEPAVDEVAFGEIGVAGSSRLARW
jgi:hypothetical protein